MNPNILTVNELRNLLRQNGVRGYSRLNRSEIISLLQQHSSINTESLTPQQSSMSNTLSPSDIDLIDLPTDVLIDLLAELDLYWLDKFCRSSSRINSLCNHPRLWKLRYEKDFKEPFPADSQLEAKEVYLTKKRTFKKMFIRMFKWGLIFDITVSLDWTIRQLIDEVKIICLENREMRSSTGDIIDFREMVLMLQGKENITIGDPFTNPVILYPYRDQLTLDDKLDSIWNGFFQISLKY